MYYLAKVIQNSPKIYLRPEHKSFKRLSPFYTKSRDTIGITWSIDKPCGKETNKWMEKNGKWKRFSLISMVFVKRTLCWNIWIWQGDYEKWEKFDIWLP